MAWSKVDPKATETPAVGQADMVANFTAIEDGACPMSGAYVETFFIGKNADSDIKLEADNGDANNPYIKYDSSSNEWQFSNDGSTDVTFGGVVSSSVILFVGTSCPTGYTNITATNDDRYLKAAVLASAAVETGGSATLDISHIHTGTTDASADDGHRVAGDGDISRGPTHVHPFTSASGGSATLANTPLSAGFLLCQKD